MSTAICMCFRPQRLRHFVNHAFSAPWHEEHVYWPVPLSYTPSFSPSASYVTLRLLSTRAPSLRPLPHIANTPSASPCPRALTQIRMVPIQRLLERQMGTPKSLLQEPRRVSRSLQEQPRTHLVSCSHPFSLHIRLGVHRRGEGRLGDTEVH